MLQKRGPVSAEGASQGWPAPGLAHVAQEAQQVKPDSQQEQPQEATDSPSSPPLYPHPPTGI